MDTTRPIRALMRGLDALTVLNLRNGATVSEIAYEIKLPRTTVYRILETLCDSGYIYRDTADDRYRLTIRVRGLSAGFGEEPWVTDIARPCIFDLCREIVWPVSVATLCGAGMTVRETTDHVTPLAIERYSAGFRVPLLTSSSGRVYLAFCPEHECTDLFDLMARSNRDEDKAVFVPRAEMQDALAEIKAQGYAIVTKSRHLIEEVSLSAPVLAADRVLAALSVRFTASAVPLQAAVERFLPRLRDCAAKIAFALLKRADSGAVASPSIPL